MRRIALALVLLSAASAVPVLAQESPAQRAARQTVERDQRQDRVEDAARDLRTGGVGPGPAVVGDMNSQRSILVPEQRDAPATTTRPNAEGSIPLLGDNVQR